MQQLSSRHEFTLQRRVFELKELMNHCTGEEKIERTATPSIEFTVA